jgi:hypothetical protein
VGEQNVLCQDGTKKFPATLAGRSFLPLYLIKEKLGHSWRLRRQVLRKGFVNIAGGFAAELNVRLLQTLLAALPPHLT